MIAVRYPRLRSLQQQNPHPLPTPEQLIWKPAPERNARRDTAMGVALLAVCWVGGTAAALVAAAAMVRVAMTFLLFTCSGGMDH